MVLKKEGLGRSLQRAHRRGPNRPRGPGPLTTVNIAVPTGSITEEKDLDEFLAVAQLAGREFVAERLTASVVPGIQYSGVPGTKLTTSTLSDQAIQTFLRIPRRPAWTTEMTAEELSRKEQESFLEWRRGLAALEAHEQLVVTPFERNLDMWRQLWRVVERSDLLVQIVDARNPLLFHCDDLVKYAAEIDPSKRSMLLVNKADYLSELQRKQWADYFTSVKLDFVFFSAIQSGEEENAKPTNVDIFGNGELLDVLCKMSDGGTVGFIGYPNVGKSSTINSLLGHKQVAVGPTPGKTKHFQTMRLENGITLLDCPGLVFPNMVASKADLVLNGILPIDQLRDFVTPSMLLVERVPGNVLESVYGLRLPLPSVDEAADRLPTASELLSTYAISRGFTKAGQGNPDESRAARHILKEYACGKLLYCHPPPSMDPAEFNEPNNRMMLGRKPAKISQQSERPQSGIDEEFASTAGYCVGTLGKNATTSFSRTVLYPHRQEMSGGASSKKHYKRTQRN